MTYNKSEIMKAAWNMHRNYPKSYPTFTAALRQAWFTAKREADLRKQGFVKPVELTIGDTLHLDGYGGYKDNKVDFVITSIEPFVIPGCTKSFITIDGISVMGKMNINVCVELNEMLQRIANAAVKEIAA